MISFAILTWNLQASQQVDLLPFVKKTLSPSPEFLIFAFQELESPFKIDLIRSEQAYFTQNGIIGSFESMKLLYVEVVKSLNICHRNGAQYFPCYIGKKAGLGMIVMVKEGIQVHKIYSGFIGTGLLGVHSNKGSLGLCLEFGYPNQPTYSTTLLNCHLGAHSGKEYFEKRQAEIDHILDCLVMKPMPNDFTGNCVKVTSSQAIFVIGDLNYRLNTSLAGGEFVQGVVGNVDSEWNPLIPKTPENIIKRLVENNDYTSLLQLDELSHVLKNHLGMLSVFVEPPIKFMPTYKKHNGVYTYKRLPAYTDRILFTTNKHTITPIVYTSLEHENASDHDSVMGMYILDFSGQCEIKAEKYDGILWKRIKRIYKVNRVGLFVTLLVIVVAFAFR